MRGGRSLAEYRRSGTHSGHRQSRWGRSCDVGTPGIVRSRLSALLEETGADHCSVITITPEHEQRELSYQRLAEAFSLKAEAA